VFEIEFGDCDESMHPRCDGVVCATVLGVAGFVSQEEAEDYARDVLYNENTVAQILAGAGDGLTAGSLMSGGRDPAEIILRDYNVVFTTTPSGSRTVVSGGHDDYGLVNPEPATATRWRAMTPSVEQTLARMDQLTAIVIAATVGEMRAAAYAIAQRVIELHPDIVRVHLTGSDQGDWLDVTGWDAGEDVEDLDLPEDVAFAAAHLYIEHIGNGDYVGAVPELSVTNRRRGTFVMDVHQVLTECREEPVAAEVTVPLDPDAGAAPASEVRTP